MSLADRDVGHGEQIAVEIHQHEDKELIPVEKYQDEDEEQIAVENH